MLTQADSTMTAPRLIQEKRATRKTHSRKASTLTNRETPTPHPSRTCRRCHWLASPPRSNLRLWVLAAAMPAWAAAGAAVANAQASVTALSFQHSAFSILLSGFRIQHVENSSR